MSVVGTRAVARSGTPQIRSRRGRALPMAGQGLYGRFPSDSSHVISSPFPELCSAHARHPFSVDEARGLIFDKEERGPDEDLRLRFEAGSAFDDDNKAVARTIHKASSSDISPNHGSPKKRPADAGLGQLPNDPKPRMMLRTVSRARS